MGSALPPRPSCSLPARRPAHGTSRCSCTGRRSTRSVSRRSAHGVVAASELDRWQTAAQLTRAVSTRARRAATSPEVLDLLQHNPPCESTGPGADGSAPRPTRACLTRSVPPPGSLTLLAACSSHGWRPYSGRSAHGDLALQSSPRPEPRRLSAPRCPPAVHRHRAPARHDWRASAPAPCAARPHSALHDSRVRCVRAEGVGSVTARLQGLAPRVESEATLAGLFDPPRRSRLSWASGSSPGFSPRRRLASAAVRSRGGDRGSLLPRASLGGAAISRLAPWPARAGMCSPAGFGLRGPSESVHRRTGRGRLRGPADPPEVSLPRRRPPFLRGGPALAHGFASGPERVAAPSGIRFGQ